MTTYIATYYVRGQRAPAERSFETLDGAMRFQVRRMQAGDLFPEAIVDHRGRTIAGQAWLLDHWSDIVDVLDAGRPPSAYAPVRALPD
jgi:hypothetical protein